VHYFYGKLFPLAVNLPWPSSESAKGADNFLQQCTKKAWNALKQLLLSSFEWSDAFSATCLLHLTLAPSVDVQVRIGNSCEFCRGTVIAVVF